MRFGVDYGILYPPILNPYPTEDFIKAWGGLAIINDVQTIDSEDRAKFYTPFGKPLSRQPKNTTYEKFE